MRYGIAILPAVFSLSVAALSAGAQGSTPAKTPHDCLTAYDADIKASVEAAVKAHQPLDGPTIVRGARANAKRCSAQFDVSTMGPSQLSDLVAFYLRTAQPTLALQTFRRLDSVPDAVVPRFKVRASLLAYYDEHDVDSGIVRIAPEMIALARQMTPAQFDANADRILRAYVTWAEVKGNALHADSALAIVRQADQDFPALASVKGWSREYLDKAIARYEMVGTRAPDLAADYWRNGTGKSINPDGPTLVMFSAHDCPACVLSYPTISRMASDYTSRGFHLVMDFDLGGDFDNKPLTPEQEVDTNVAYYRRLNLTCPMAFQRPGKTDENGNQVPGPDANSVRYHTSGVPYYYVVDRQGIIRAVLVGWDTSGLSETSLRSLITQMLSPSAQG